MRTQGVRLLLISVLALISLVPEARLLADPIVKHPRVAELEDRLAKDASTYLRGRFPERPYMVTVSVDPMRRVTGSRVSGEGEKLPYLDLESEEVQDEWDDPQISLSELMLRLKKAVVKVQLPQDISESEVQEVRDGLFQVLHLTPARDEVTIDRKAWGGQTWWRNSAIGIFVLLLALFGLYLILRDTSRRLARSLQEASRASSTAGSASVPIATPLSAEKATGKREGGAQGDLQFSDVFKIRELAQDTATFLSSSEGFPTLRDMIVLDQLGRNSPRALGAVLSEFPEAMRNTLFSLSFHPCWMHALHDPGEIDASGLSVLTRLRKHPHTKARAAAERALISVWRLGAEMPVFVRQLTRDQGFALLSAMPKSVSLPVARKAYPGAWGALLDPTFKATKVTEPEYKEIAERALVMHPLNDRQLLETYQAESDLLSFLKTSEFSEEREVYEASPIRDSLTKLRPPFYPVFDLDDGSLKSLVQRFSLDDWALALFNCPRAERKKLLACFSDKQRFHLQELFKAFDNHPPDRAQVGAIRERIGALVPLVLQVPANPQPEAIGVAKTDDDSDDGPTELRNAA